MIIQLYVIGIITNLVFAYGGEDSLRTFSKVGGKYLASKLNPRIIQNREGLKKIIRALNEHFDDESDVREDDVVNQLNNRDDEVEVENQVGQIKKILGLLQKNYNSQTRYSKLLEKAQPRIYYIENPEIIKQFQTQLRSKGKSTSSSSEITDFDRSFKDDDSSNYRREAIFERFNLASSENIHAPRNDPIDIDDRPNRFSGLSIESGPRNRDDRTQPKGRFKIAREKRHDVTSDSEKKRKRGLIKSNRNSNKKKLSEDSIGAIDEKFDNRYIAKGSGPREQPRERPGGRLKINRDLVKFSDEEQWKGRNSFKGPNEPIVRRPNKHNYQQPSGGRNSKPFGRTFIPYIGKKSIYEENK